MYSSASAMMMIETMNWQEPIEKIRREGEWPTREFAAIQT
jgi:hypothetical protein